MPEGHLKFRPAGEIRKVLLIEDEIINQEILKMYLQDTYEVLAAGTGREALDIIHAQYETISLVLLDLNLPDMHGIDILRHIEQDSRYACLPVIVMTADNESEVECLTEGAIDFIPKPYPQQKVVLARALRTIELFEDRDILSWTERDSLTGLYNKDFFYRYASQLDAYHKDEPTDAIVVNINHFRVINDRCGKNCGDEVLKQVAEKLLEIVQTNGGIVCRREADTFLIYSPHSDDYHSFLEEASVILNIEEMSETRVWLRMGIYADVDKSLDIERRFDRAKMAADRVKDNFNKNIGLFDNSMREAELLAGQLIADFPAAIREKQFEIFYQPKFNVRSEKPVLSSAEALVRWRHPKLGMVSPGVFIPLFENNGLIQTLDHYIWSEAAAHVRGWKERLGIALPVSINVSRVDMYDPQLIEKLKAVVEDNGLGFNDLFLEVTESAYTEDAGQIIDKVRQLRDLGFHIEMDDFGAGYSSLTMLSMMPIDALKLDMQFVRNAFKNGKDTRLLEVMIRLAEAFKVITIAEGVETEEQMLTLQAIGCDIVQGYYFSRPLPAEEFEAFMTSCLSPGLKR
ncbi:MAG: EAL domain-containing protein [bacterium]|nr:EAL domain-containing protein [bacterium]